MLQLVSPADSPAFTSSSTLIFFPFSLLLILTKGYDHVGPKNGFSDIFYHVLWPGSGRPDEGIILLIAGRSSSVITTFKYMLENLKEKILWQSSPLRYCHLCLPLIENTLTLKVMSPSSASENPFKGRRLWASYIYKEIKKSLIKATVFSSVVKFIL